MSEHFSGHDIETGLLQRLRSWRDVLPPLILFDSLRVCGSPVYLAISLVTVIAISAILSGGEVDSRVSYPTLTNLFVIPDISRSWNGLLCTIAVALLGMLPAAATMRLGAIYAAKRDAEPTLAGLKVIWLRGLPMLLALVLPLVCIVGLSVPIAALATVGRIPMIGDGFAEVVGVLLAPLVILIGLVGAGAFVAIPIGLASLAIEKRSDPFDALSRGYEYLYRRPIQLAVYLAINVATALFLGWMAQWVAFAGSMLGGVVYAIGSGGETLPLTVRVTLAHFPMAVSMTSFFALLGAIYLLLRKDANEQEIEDIVISAVDRRADLPSLQIKPSELR